MHRLTANVDSTAIAAHERTMFGPALRRALRRGILIGASLVPAGTADAQQRVTAPSKSVCGQAYVDAQHLRAAGRLVAARAQLTVCAADACPKAVRPDCAQWLTEVNAQVSSVALHARDSAGGELADVRVNVDGVVVADGLQGQPIELDPGPHSLRFEHPGTPPLTQEIVAVLGEKLRPLEIQFATTPPLPSRSTPPNPRPVLPPATRPVPAAAWVLGGAGIAGGAAAAVLWGLAESRYSDLSSTCAPRCNPSQADAPRTELIAGDVAAGAGAAALVAGAILYLARPTQVGAEATAGRLDLIVSDRSIALSTRW
jgi:hypothetical protein